MPDLRVKFNWVAENGQPTGLLATKGSLADQTLTLGTTQLPVGAITEVETRGDFLILSVLTGEGTAQALVLKSSKAAQLAMELGRIRSALWAEAHRQELEKRGEGRTFRSEVCPSCAAVIDLTGMPVTPQISCEFCRTISTLPAAKLPEGQTPGPERGYRLCDECGMYSKPRQFTIFYFYFLLVVYGWNSRLTWRCPACMRRDAWKMLAGNLPFVLGVPTAGVQLFRSYGGTDVGGMYPGLDRANLRARKGDLDGAIKGYMQLLQRRPLSAGIKYNIGATLLQQQRTEEASRMFEYALGDCANYRPAAAALAGCYETLGQQEKLAELKRRWSVSDDPPPGSAS